MSCKGCGKCCIRNILMSESEVDNLIDFIRKNHIKLSHVDRKCALLDSETHFCLAYEARPSICRFWEAPSKESGFDYCTIPKSKRKTFDSLKKSMKVVDTWTLEEKI